MSKFYPCLVSRTIAGLPANLSKRQRRLLTPVVSLTIARSKTEQPRNEIPYYTIAKFTAIAFHYIWKKLSGAAVLQSNRPTEYREKIVQLDNEGNVITTASGLPKMKVVRRTATFDTNLIDDCLQQSLVYWHVMQYEPHAAMFFGTRHYITATQRLKVTGNSEKALDTAPSVKKYSCRLTLTADTTGELAEVECCQDMPNLVQLAFTDIRPISKARMAKNRKVSPKTIQNRRSAENAKLIRDVKEWFREGLPSQEAIDRMPDNKEKVLLQEEYDAVERLKMERKEWNKQCKDARELPTLRYNATIARLAYGPPTFADSRLIVEHRRNHYQLLAENWGDRTYGCTGPVIKRNRQGMLPGHNLRQLRISNPSLCYLTDEVTMTGYGMGV